MRQLYTNIQSVSRNVSGTGTQPPASNPKTTTESSYTVKSGDTLWKIANDNGMSVRNLIKLNPQISDPDVIHIGDKIKLKPDANLERPQLQQVDNPIEAGWKQLENSSINNPPLNISHVEVMGIENITNNNGIFTDPDGLTVGGVTIPGPVEFNPTSGQIKYGPEPQHTVVFRDTSGQLLNLQEAHFDNNFQGAVIQFDNGISLTVARSTDDKGVNITFPQDVSAEEIKALGLQGIPDGYSIEAGESVFINDEAMQGIYDYLSKEEQPTTITLSSNTKIKPGKVTENDNMTAIKELDIGGEIFEDVKINYSSDPVEITFTGDKNYSIQLPQGMTAETFRNFFNEGGEVEITINDTLTTIAKNENGLSTIYDGQTYNITNSDIDNIWNYIQDKMPELTAIIKG
jgi:LysM repeat protein